MDYVLPPMCVYPLAVTQTLEAITVHFLDLPDLDFLCLAFA